MHDDDLDRLAHLVRESRARSAVATLAAALTAEVRSFPTGQRAERLMARARVAAEVESRPWASLVVRVIGQLIEVLGGAVSTAALVRGGTQDGVLVREAKNTHWFFPMQIVFDSEAMWDWWMEDKHDKGDPDQGVLFE